MARDSDYGGTGADRLVCDEIHDWHTLMRKLVALETLDLDYVLIRNREGEQDTVGWCLRLARGTQETISEADVVYRPKQPGEV